MKRSGGSQCGDWGMPWALWRLAGYSCVAGPGVAAEPGNPSSGSQMVEWGSLRQMWLSLSETTQIRQLIARVAQQDAHGFLQRAQGLRAIAWPRRSAEGADPCAAQRAILGWPSCSHLLPHLSSWPTHVFWPVRLPQTSRVFMKCAVPYSFSLCSTVYSFVLLSFGAGD